MGKEDGERYHEIKKKKKKKPTPPAKASVHEDDGGLQGASLSLPPTIPTAYEDRRRVSGTSGLHSLEQPGPSQDPVKTHFSFFPFFCL